MKKRYLPQMRTDHKQLLDEVEQNIVICLWQADHYYLPKPKAEANN